jgi:hypothetical protein
MGLQVGVVRRTRAVKPPGHLRGLTTLLAELLAFFAFILSERPLDPDPQRTPPHVLDSPLETSTTTRSTRARHR